MESLQVARYMSHHPVKLHFDMPVAEAVERLLDSHQTGGPVIDANGRIAGFLSEQDCIRNMMESSYYREQVCRVKDIMTTPVETVKPYTSILEIAQKMITLVPKVYPVVDDDGYLVGCITRTDVLKAIDMHLRSGYKQAS